MRNHDISNNVSLYSPVSQASCVLDMLQRCCGNVCRSYDISTMDVRVDLVNCNGPSKDGSKHCTANRSLCGVVDLE